ncbi:ABC transporter periplasmic binding protein [Salmonella enterica subsp. enterica serovar Pullorum]|nr:ABC transporter periplasmic binding protein [Salmonella enterica subsp. enterica serovar Pullorum]
MTVQYLQKKGFQVQPQTNIAAVISRNAMVNKQIDITWEYTGTSLIIFNRIDKRMSPTGNLRHGKTPGCEAGPGMAQNRLT